MSGSSNIVAMKKIVQQLRFEANINRVKQLGSLASQQLLSGQFQAAIPQSPPKINDPVPQRRQKTVSVYCHEEAIEVVMNADLFASGIPVYAEELRLGSESLLNKVSAASCGAVQTGESELTIFAYFRDCGTKLSVTGDSLVYSNVIVYSPLPTPDGVIHQEGAVIPVQCQYRRWQSVDGNDEVCNTCEPSRQAAAEKEPIQPLRITLAPPVKQSVLAPKPGPADFFRVRPDWSKVATLGPLFLIPKQETTTRSTGYPQSGPAEVFSAFVDEEPELLFNSTRESPMTDELDFKTDHETKNGPLVKDLFLNASDLFSSEEGSGFEE
ncbi:zona pellucida sperm-binding 3-like protein [Labeo rohita]|uniref:Zona pellucida sperm-binding 3-like protein n=1 Tax=Labeo rohita TaxID=84645 RepID=A0A498M3B7_LABRO|nr:zona pellucida sperm-binding 3-like protein [Labeo rohita]